jgi:hypothetical protein
MDGMPKAESASDAPAWHAMAAQEVTGRLTTDSKKGLNASEASGSSRSSTTSWSTSCSAPASSS